MLLAVTAGTVGDILSTKGMKELGDISVMNLRGMKNAFIQALVSPKLILGTVMLTDFFTLAGGAFLERPLGGIANADTELRVGCLPFTKFSW
jgi:hypothetical protein